MENRETELKKREVLRMSNIESNQLTRDCICTALLSLLAVETFDKITVTSIIKRSGVSRAGFYRNYSSKEDVLDQIGNELLSFLSSFITDYRLESNPKAWYLDLFNLIKEKSDTFGLLLKAKVPHSFVFKAESLAEQLFQCKTPKERYLAIAISKSVTEISATWFENGMKESPEEMAEFFVELFHQRKD